MTGIRTLEERRKFWFMNVFINKPQVTEYIFSRFNSVMIIKEGWGHF